MNPKAETWDKFEWPDWVPEKLRKMVENFWSPKLDRGPRQWHAGATADFNGHPAFGAEVAVRDWHNKEIAYVGRWVPTWNNMGAVVLSGGTFVISSTNDFVDKEIAHMMQTKEARRKVLARCDCPVDGEVMGISTHCPVHGYLAKDMLKAEMAVERAKEACWSKWEDPVEGLIKERDANNPPTPPLNKGGQRGVTETGK